MPALIIRKGSHRNIDSYSAFLEADRTTKTGLDGYFTSRGITEIYLCGLAPIFASPGQPKMRKILGLKRQFWKTPAAPSTSTVR